MARSFVRKDPAEWGKQAVAPGDRRSVNIEVSRSYSGFSIRVPVFVWRGLEEGPTVFVSAAVHGDEINGAGAIRRMIVEEPFELRAGTLIMAPVINILGFERHSRYLPDRRDLNRCFPGSHEGSIASRLAAVVFDEIVCRSDFGIDLHTAAVRRTNFPNVRADMSDPATAELAKSFGSELIVDGKGPRGSLRRAACGAGCPTIILEAGEVWKVEPSVVEYAVRGVKSVLAHKGMIDQEPSTPAYQVAVTKTKWVRAQEGGLLTFHAAPGEVVEEGQPLATNTSLLGREQNVLRAPEAGLVLGMTTLPSVAPGDPVFHIALPGASAAAEMAEAQHAMKKSSLHARIRKDLATSVMIRPFVDAECEEPAEEEE